jgi:predicted secreted acid phosphatase
VLLAPEGIASLTARRRPCGGTEPAVIIDLDNGPAAFSPDSAGTPAPGLANALARLREAGVVVLWISGTDANRVNDVADALRRTGLDPTGRDPLLLALSEDDRKQTMREEANEDVCVVAIAGDRRADFDELFDYLRSPDAAAGLDALVGSGWFITPVPLATVPPRTE